MDELVRERVRQWRAESTDANAQAVARACSRLLADCQGPRKVLVCPGYGGGFASEVEPAEAAQFVAEYGPLVEAVETGNGFTAAMGDLRAEVEARWGHESVRYLDPAVTPFTSLRVREVTGPYRIRSYDGSESIETLAQAIEAFW